uniref:Uncharacterized protein n=1 Tax=Anguilla anguilla TaxID=7936 RepID=A0A0E9V1L2_ANGAN
MVAVIRARRHREQGKTD